MSRVLGDFGELAYDRLVVATGAQVGWDGAVPPAGDLGAVDAGRGARRPGGTAPDRPASRVVVAASTPAYRCPPAVLDLAIRLRHQTGAQVTVAHPWPAPLAPFGPGPSAGMARLLDQAGVAFKGGYSFAQVHADRLVDAAGAEVPFDAARVRRQPKGPLT